jgi:hypothetical protein
MIRGIDPAVREVIKSAAKAEGISVGRWVRRALQHALESAANDQKTLDDVGERMRALEARLDALEKSHRNLDLTVRTANDSIEYPQSKDSKAWLRPKRSRSS